MNKQDKTIELMLENKQKQLTESHNDIIEFKVKNLIKQNLTNDKDINKAQDLLKAYNDFKNIAKNYIDVPYDVCKLSEDGMEKCYQYLAQLLKTDKLY